MKRTIIEFLVGLPVVVGLYFLLDFLYCTFIVNTPFVFNIRNCGMAVGIWAIVEIITYFIRSRKDG
jgi:hypothetical protein